MVLLRLHSGSRAALFSVVLELHKSKVYRFLYLDFCATAFIRRIAAFFFFGPRNFLVVNLLGAFWCLPKKRLLFQPLILTAQTVRYNYDPCDAGFTKSTSLTQALLFE